MFNEAVQLYMQGELWDKALPLAEKISPEMVEEVKAKSMEAITGEVDAAGLAEAGDTSGALAAYLAQGDYAKLIELARQGGEKTIRTYSPHYVQHLLEQNRAVEAVQAAMKDGITETIEHAGTYSAMVEGFIASLPVEFNYTSFNEQLFKLVKALKAGPNSSDPVVGQLEARAKIMHTYCMADRCHKNGLFDLWGKCMLEQCKHIDVIPADKAFYDAGMAAKKCAKEDHKAQHNWASYCFVYWNRFLDINELMEDPDADVTLLDPTDLLDTGIPTEFPIPKRHSVPNENAEEIRQWVLTASLDQTIEQRLPTPEIRIGAELEEIFKQILKGGIPAVLQSRS